MCTLGAWLFWLVNIVEIWVVERITVKVELAKWSAVVVICEEVMWFEDWLSNELLVVVV